MITELNYFVEYHKLQILDGFSEPVTQSQLSRKLYLKMDVIHNAKKFFQCMGLIKLHHKTKINGLRDSGKYYVLTTKGKLLNGLLQRIKKIIDTSKIFPND